MRFLLRSARIFDVHSTYHQEQKDILIDNGTILAVEDPGTIAAEGAEEIVSNDLSISLGWVELHSTFCDPGYEDRETLETGLQAAKAGGFTAVALTPETQPVADSKSILQYWQQNSKGTGVTVLPLGALTKNIEGKELAELYDLHEAGAIGFYDGKHPIVNPNLLKLALQYTKKTGVPVYVHPFSEALALGGVMHEGEVSTYLGLKGMPNMSEAMMVNRDLYLLAYTGGRLHFAGISTKESVALIKEAKVKGLQVTADVNFYNLIATDANLESYNSNLKVNPPLRELDDIAALWVGVEEGVIDAIAVDHTPWNIERKVCEFQLAAFGMASIETAFSALVTNKPDTVALDTVISALTKGPREVLKLPAPIIETGCRADFTLFDPTLPAEVSRKTLAYNDHYRMHPLTGKVLLTISAVS